MMKVTGRFKRLLAASLLAVASVALVWGAAGAQGDTFPPLDHYKTYLLATPEIGVPGVFVKDQFSEGVFDLRGPRFFSLPAEKDHAGVITPILHPEAHLTWYELFDPQPGRRVVYQNQFLEDALFVRDGVFLLAPALKFPDATQPLPDMINHFKCYKAQGRAPDVTVKLHTQFGDELLVQVGPPELFCNPAEKIDPAGRPYPIVNPRDHLVCYRIFPPQPLGVSIVYRDQFIFSQGVLLENMWLCVPSLKTGVTDSETSTWGRVKSMYR